MALLLTFTSIAQTPRTTTEGLAVGVEIGEGEAGRFSGIPRIGPEADLGGMTDILREELRDGLSQ